MVRIICFQVLRSKISNLIKHNSHIFAVKEPHKHSNNPYSFGKNILLIAIYVDWNL